MIEQILLLVVLFAVILSATVLLIIRGMDNAKRWILVVFVVCFVEECLLAEFLLMHILHLLLIQGAGRCVW